MTCGRIPVTHPAVSIVHQDGVQVRLPPMYPRPQNLRRSHESPSIAGATPLACFALCLSAGTWPVQSEEKDAATTLPVVTTLKLRRTRTRSCRQARVCQRICQGRLPRGEDGETALGGRIHLPTGC